MLATVSEILSENNKVLIGANGTLKWDPCGQLELRTKHVNVFINWQYGRLSYNFCSKYVGDK